MRAQRTVDVASARHHARVLVRQAVVLQTRSVRILQKSKSYLAKKRCRMVALFVLLGDGGKLTSISVRKEGGR